MPMFRKKPVVIQAEQWFPGDEVAGVHGTDMRPGTTIRFDVAGAEYTSTSPCVVTVHRHVTPVAPGDWIIPESDGLHHYPCKPDVFDRTYEPVTL